MGADTHERPVSLLLYPKGVLQQRLAADPRLFARVFETLARITGEMFLSESRVHGGGLRKLEPKELARVFAELILAAVKGIRPALPRKLFVAASEV